MYGKNIGIYGKKCLDTSDGFKHISNKRNHLYELHIFHMSAITGNHALQAGDCGQYSLNKTARDIF